MRKIKEERIVPFSAITIILLAGCIGISHADIKIGSYAWAHKYNPATNYGVPAANAYGGGYNHIDISWTWTMENGMQRVNNDWTTAANCLDDNPTWFAGHTGMQSANYMLKKMYPATWARIKSHSDAGRYDGGEMAWSEGYFDFGGDEYYLRNYYISTRFCMDNFGYLPQVACGYDLDAPTWTQPKIQTYISGKSSENPTGLGFMNHDTWNWGCMLRPNGWTQHRWTSDDGSMVVVGTGGEWSGDGGGAEVCASSAGRFSTFASKVFQENTWNTSVPNVWNDNLISMGSGYSLFWWGAKMCENRLLEAEKFATFARPYGYVYPLNGDAYLYDVWGGFIKFNQHDVADAQGTPWQVALSNTTNLNMQDAYTSALKVADTTLTRALSVISSNINTAGTGKSVIAYNALSWTRSDYVMVKTSDLGFSNPVQVQDASGAVVPSQVIDFRGLSTLVFTAENVPSLGYKQYRVLNSTAASTPASVTAANATDITMSNEYCTVTINKTSGLITGITDKVNAKELMGAPGNTVAATTNNPNWWENCYGFYGHEAGGMPNSPPVVAPTSVQLLDAGPAIARVKLTYTTNNVSWDHFIMLFSKVPVVNNRMVTANLSNDNELVVELPLNTAVANGSKVLNCGVAYGHQLYTNRTNYMVTQKWANVANDAKTYSVSLLENNCGLWSFYGIGGQRDLRLVLLAEKPSNWGGHWSKTDWQMSWGIWGHPGDWTDGTVQKGYEFNSPLISRVEASHAGQLPKEYSFLTVDPENVVVTAVKKWESESPTRADSLTMQVRFFEIDGKNTDAVFHFPSNHTVSAWESKGNEYGVYGNALPVTADAAGQKVTFSMGHNQIRSLKIQTPYSATPVRPDARCAGPLSLMSINTGTMRLCNTKGQVIWQGRDLPQLRTLSRADGMYVLQVLGRDGKLISARKICRSANGMKAGLGR